MRSGGPHTAWCGSRGNIRQAAKREEWGDVCVPEGGRRQEPRHAPKKGGTTACQKKGEGRHAKKGKAACRRDDGGKIRRARARSHQREREDVIRPRDGTRPSCPAKGRRRAKGEDGHAREGLACRTSQSAVGARTHPARGREIPRKTRFFVFADSEFSLEKPEPLKTFS